MRRRDFITLLGGAATAWPLAARAQQGKLATIGYLGPTTLASTSPWLPAFVQRLRELQWVEGRNVAIDYRWAEGSNERMAEIAAEFARLKVDIIFHPRNRGLCCEASYLDDPHRVRVGDRSGRHRHCCELGAARRQHHRAVDPRHGSGRQTIRTVARACPWPAPLGDNGQRRRSRRVAGDAGGRGNGAHGRSRNDPIRIRAT